MPQKIQHPCRIPPPNHTKIEFDFFLDLLLTLFKTVAETFVIPLTPLFSRSDGVSVGRILILIRTAAKFIKMIVWAT